jgi:TRAP-type transport system periplasmic protein
MEKRLARDGLRLLYSVPWPTVGVFLKGKGEIKGQKIRTYDKATSRFVELLGGIPTPVQAAEVPQAFATGIIGGMVTSSTTAHDTKAWEYVKAYYDLKLSFPMNMVFVNDRAFRALGADEQKALLEAARKAEARGWERAEKLQQEMDAKITQNGIEFIPVSAAQQAELQKIGTSMAQEWAGRAGSDGAELLRKLGR